MRILSFRTCILAAALGFTAFPAWTFGIGLQPTTVEIEVAPGERNRQVINIANVHTEKTISLTLGLADWSLDENGQIQLSPPDETDTSAAGWARFSPAFLTLKPGESEQVIVDMATPTRLARSGDFRFALLASTVLPEERSGQSGVWKKYQIATLFYLTTGSAKSEAAITAGEVSVTEEGVRNLHLGIENSGNAHARLQGVIEINSGGSLETVPITNLVVLHEGRRDYVTRLPDDVPADASIEVRLNNIFAPQTNGETLALPPYRISHSTVAEPVAGSGSDSTELNP
jgi:P pilus assembly chaperone PapD